MNTFDGPGNEHLIRLLSSSEVVCSYLSSSTFWPSRNEWWL